jgi:hypothetical protein
MRMHRERHFASAVRRSWGRLLGLFTLVLTACESAPTPESYYPLEPGLVRQYVMSGEMEMFAGWKLQRTGWHRTMRSRALDNYVLIIETQTPRLINGRDATPMMASSDFNRDFWFSFLVVDEGGIAEVGRQKRGAQPKALEEPYYLLRFPIREGRSWDVKEPQDFLDGEIMLSGRAWVAGVDEIVTVPAGTFRNCIRIESEASGSKRIPDLHGKGVSGEASLEVKVTNWLAPRIGMVKGIQRATASPEALGSAEQMLELTKVQGLGSS